MDELDNDRDYQAKEQAAMSASRAKKIVARNCRSRDNWWSEVDESKFKGRSIVQLKGCKNISGFHVAFAKADKTLILWKTC